MDPKWAGIGSEAGWKWVGGGPKVDQKWAKSGLGVDQKWSRSGPDMHQKKTIFKGNLLFIFITAAKSKKKQFSSVLSFQALHCDISVFKYCLKLMQSLTKNPNKLQLIE